MKNQSIAAKRLLLLSSLFLAQTIATSSVCMAEPLPARDKLPTPQDICGPRRILCVPKPGNAGCTVKFYGDQILPQPYIEAPANSPRSNVDYSAPYYIDIGEKRITVRCWEPERIDDVLSLIGKKLQIRQERTDSCNHETQLPCISSKGKYEVQFFSNVMLNSPIPVPEGDTVTHPRQTRRIQIGKEGFGDYSCWTPSDMEEVKREIGKKLNLNESPSIEAAELIDLNAPVAPPAAPPSNVAPESIIQKCGGAKYVACKIDGKNCFFNVDDTQKTVSVSDKKLTGTQRDNNASYGCMLKTDFSQLKG